jgi:ketosteroid isomerase-like protein
VDNNLQDLIVRIFAAVQAKDPETVMSLFAEDAS